MSAAALDDPIRNEWLAACTAAVLPVGDMHPCVLLGERVVVTRAHDGSVHAYADQCPHRGAQLSLGQFRDDRIECPYHGWQFNADGRCVTQPAHPTLIPPPHCRLTDYQAIERYGFVWVCLGDEPRHLTNYAAFDRRPDRNVIHGPEVVHTSAPRIVENFLDMAHFPFVHGGYLGQTPHTEVRNYTVMASPFGVEATDCWFWQPQPGPHATAGGEVAYRYWVDTPYAASLDKLPADVDGGDAGSFSLLIVATPIDETTCNTWMITSAYGDDTPLQVFKDFNEVILTQDIPVVESQRPQLLPLDPFAERHQAADRLALAYRAWLRDRGVRYGTSANDPANAEPPAV